ncbi:Tetratricopeptide repeat protein [Flavobacterium longum]|uniref:hypothetical protein n=1 Tax=Flavobacterium longum TaxID=1299340 RepID=UPI0039EB27E5
MKKLLVTLWLAQCWLAVAQKDYAFVYQTDSIINSGIRLHDEEKYEDALKYYDKIVPTDPEYFWAQYEKALTLSHAGKKEELGAHFTRLYDSGSMKKYPELYLLYGSFLSDAESFDQSEKVFNEGLPYQPNSSGYLYNMAILYLRKEENQKALDLLKKTITLNPNYASAHYFLGLLAYDNGKIGEATMAMMSYLAISPKGRYAKDAVLKLNANYAQNYLGKNQLVFSASGDNFEELEVILRNGLPLKKAYKVKSEIDDIAIRQSQAVADYALEHKAGDGFFETTYLPWIADMNRKNFFEGYSYYMLLGLEEELGKKLSSHKKEITTFYEQYVDTDFWDAFGKRKVDHFGTVQDVLISISDGKPFLVGAAAKTKEGKFKKLNDQGNVAAELQFKNDMAEGLQKYFNKEGRLTEEVNYTAGKRNGKETSYFSNGQVSGVYDYKDHVLNGSGISYYPTGGKQCVSNYKDDKRHGLQTCYYPNGTKKSELTYTDGKANGMYTFYNESGDLTRQYNYVDDELEGDYFEYYDGKILKSEAKYSKGKPVGSIKSYYPNKALQAESIYADGKITTYRAYYLNGKLSDEITYDANGDTDTYAYYDWYGRKYYVEKFKSGEIKSGTQYTKAKPEGVALSLSKKPYVITDYDGNPILKGNFDKGKKTGEWTYYHSNGNVRQKEHYTAGEENGLTQNYYRNGLLKSAYNMKDGKISGLYESYDDGIMTQSIYQTDDEQNGPYQAFREDGKVSHEGFVVNGTVVEDQTTYWMSGQPMFTNHYVDGEIVSVDFYNPKGEKETTADYVGKNGKMTYSFYNKLTTVEAEMANGERNGTFRRYEKNNVTMIEAAFVNGKETGAYKNFSPTGALHVETNYYNGERHGQSKRNDLNGKLRLTEQWLFGDDYGQTVRYYNNGKKMCEYTSLDGDIEGEQKYYNMAGEPVLTLFYENGVLKHYMKLDASGAVAQREDVSAETADIVSQYPNGKTAMQLTFKKGILEGNFVVNGTDGKPQYSAQYANNSYNGERLEYYPSGKIYKKEQFKSGKYHGKQEYFAEDGKPLFVANYAEGDLHGDFLQYTNGVLTLTKKYDTDELVYTSK